MYFFDRFSNEHRDVQISVVSSRLLLRVCWQASWVSALFAIYRVLLFLSCTCFERQILEDVGVEFRFTETLFCHKGSILELRRNLKKN